MLTYVAKLTYRPRLLLHMSNKLFNKPLELTIGVQTLRFSSVSDITFSMEGRTAISSTKLSELFKQTIDQLEKQAKSIAGINKSLFSILTRAVEDPDSIERSIREIDPLTFSHDQGWRDIIHALNDGDEEFNPIRITALTKYIKYLSSLEETISYICSEKKQAIGAPVDDNEQEMRKFDSTWALNEMLSESISQPKDPFKRLPKNKEVSVTLPPGGQLDVRLASHMCQLVATNDYVQFIDNTGATILSKGRNIIGRGAESTVKIDVALKDVSRTHLHILISDDHTLQLTDLSSAGTYITTEFIT